MTPAELKTRIEQINTLPTLPQIVSKIAAMVESPRTSVADVGRVISKDQVLTARVLKLVNSAFYGFAGRVSSITHAMVLLGFNAVKGLVLSAAVFDLFQQEERDGLDRKRLWEHSIGTARVSGLLAQKAKLQEPEEAVVAGLLHDLGKIVLCAHLPDEFASIVDLAKSQHLRMAEAELQVLGVTHAEIGRWLLERWKLPPKLIEPVALHHTPHLAREAPLTTAVVHLANILCTAVGIGDSGDQKISPLSTAAWNLLGITMDQVEEALGELDEHEILTAFA
jgi:putative nucleotidyltransferase with HDIG domain